MQIDWVGSAPKKPFKDIRNTKDAVAAEKARLCLEIGELCRVIPPKIKSGGSINEVREWKLVRDNALKAAGNRKSSVADLTSSISNLRRVMG